MPGRLAPEEVGLHSLRPKPGSRRARKRVGRGAGSGLGKTSGRGHKGAGARSGNKRKAGYEGGQNPIHMRTRKLRGPHRKMSMPFEKFRTHTQPVNVADLEARFDAGDEVTPETLRAAGLAKRRHPVKVLGRGELTKKLTVRAHAFSASAKEKIEKAGGSARGGRELVLQTIANAFKVAEIRKKLAFTAAMLLLYRLGAYIPAPGVDLDTVKDIESNFSGSNILGFLNLFSGGSLSRLSLFALGIMPYITASIILQLMTVVVPSLERLQKEGEVGQQKITQYTRYLTVALAFAQSLGYVFLFQSFQDAGGDQRGGHAHVRQGVPDRDRPDGGHDPADVAGRADHPARHRQRDLADDLRLDRLAASQPASRRGGPTRTRSSW